MQSADTPAPKGKRAAKAVAKQEAFKQQVATSWLTQCDLRVVESLEQVDDMIVDLLQGPFIVFDTETTGLRVKDDHVVAIQFAASPDTAYFIPVGMVDPRFTNLRMAEVVARCRVLWEKGLVGHNIGYDWKMMQQSGVDFGIVADTMLETKLYDVNIRAGLKDVSMTLLGMSEVIPFKSLFPAAVKSEQRRFDVVGYDMAVPYACQDVLLTFRLHQFFQQCPEIDVNHFIYQLEHQLIKPMCEMEMLGVRLDLEKIEAAKLEAERIMAEQKAIIDAAAGSWEPNLDKPADVRKLLYTQLGLASSKQTTTGLDSTDAGTLKLLAGHPVVDAIIQYREVAKLKQAFLDALPEKVQSDGCIHTSYHQYGADSGRMSSSDPNLQQIPKERGLSADALRKAIRSSFLPPPGYVGFLDIDYCLAPGTRVLRSDLTWSTVESLSVGDELVGFDEDISRARAEGHCFKPTTVEGIKHLRQPSYRVVTDRGTVVASALHRWLGRRVTDGGNRRNREWLQSQELRPGDSISFLAEPWEVDTSYDAGYLAGFFDGEGYVSTGGVGFGQNPGQTCDRVLALLQERGFTFAFSKTSNPQTQCGQYRIGGYEPTLRFLGSVRPPRLLAKSQNVWNGKQTWGKTSKPATVLSVEFIGEQDVVAVQTSERTLIAEGFLSHNSQIEYRLFASLAQESGLLDAFAKEIDVHVQTAASMLHLSLDEVKANKHLRQKGKSLNFAAIYGASKYKLAEMLGCTADEALQLLDQYWKALSKAAVYVRNIKNTARQKGYTETFFGRRRKLPGITSNNIKERSGAERQAVNTAVQGTASDLIKMAIVRAHGALKEKGFKSRLVLTVHDELVVAHHPDDALDQLSELMRWAMEIEVPGWCAMISEPGYGLNWNDISDFSYPSRREGADVQALPTAAPVTPALVVPKPPEDQRAVLTLELTPDVSRAMLEQVARWALGTNGVFELRFRIGEDIMVAERTIQVDRALLMRFREHKIPYVLSPAAQKMLLKLVA